MCICVIFILDEYGFMKMRAIDQRKNLQKKYKSHKLELDVYLGSKVESGGLESLPPLYMNTCTRCVPGE